MSSSPNGSRILRATAVLLLFGVAYIPHLALTTEVRADAFAFRKDTLDCAIAIRHRMFNSTKNNVGFNYELLNAFGDNNSSEVRIGPPAGSPECWESLLDGSLQIIVCDRRDTIPEKYASAVIMSVPIKDDDVWVVSADNRRLANAVNCWFYDLQNDRFLEELSYRYFRSYNIEKLAENGIKVDALSPYDGMIKKYSVRTGIDWRLLSAMIYQESRFSIGVSSSKSASGLMQVKPSTAARYGIDNLYDPDSNLKAGTMHFNHLLNFYRKQGLDSINVIKFALASYNAGQAEIEARRTRAAEEGYDPDVWEEVLESVGRDNGPTATYINEILERYELYRTVIR